MQSPVGGIGTDICRGRQNPYRGGLGSFDLRFTYLREGGHQVSRSPGPGKLVPPKLRSCTLDQHSSLGTPIAPSRIQVECRSGLKLADSVLRCPFGHRWPSRFRPTGNYETRHLTGGALVKRPNTASPCFRRPSGRLQFEGGGTWHEDSPLESAERRGTVRGSIKVCCP